MFATADLLQVSARALLDKQFPWLRAAEKRAGCEPASARGTGLTRVARSGANAEE